MLAASSARPARQVCGTRSEISDGSFPPSFKQCPRRQRDRSRYWLPSSDARSLCSQLCPPVLNYVDSARPYREVVNTTVRSPCAPVLTAGSHPTRLGDGHTTPPLSGGVVCSTVGSHNIALPRLSALIIWGGDMASVRKPTAPLKPIEARVCGGRPEIPGSVFTLPRRQRGARCRFADEGFPVYPAWISRPSAARSDSAVLDARRGGLHR